MMYGKLPKARKVMLIALDIGNNHVTIGGFDGDDIRFVAAIATDPKRTGEEYACLMQNVLALHHADKTPITGAAICSVVPDMADIMHNAVAFLTDGPILEVGAGVKTGLNIKITEPRTLGTDRVVTAVHASHAYPMPCVIVDLGTATTYTALDASGALVGSAITAGVRLSLSALNEHTAQLPTVGLREIPDHVLGKNTAEALCIGAVYGTAAMIDGLVSRYGQALGAQPTVVLTGGMAETIRPYLTTAAIHEPTLALRGLADIWHRNHGRNAK